MRANGTKITIKILYYLISLHKIHCQNHSSDGRAYETGSQPGLGFNPIGLVCHHFSHLFTFGALANP